MDSDTIAGIEESILFLAVVTEVYAKELEHKDEIAYAKTLGKPFALAIEKGVDPGDLFEGCNVIGRLEFDRGQMGAAQIAKKVNKWVAGLEAKHKEGAE